MILKGLPHGPLFSYQYQYVKCFLTLLDHEKGMVVKRRFRGIFLPLALYLVSGAAALFFINEARNGSRGIDTRNALLAEISRLNADYLSLKSDRLVLEHRNAMLSSSSLDLDMLEERARLILNRGNKNDVVITLMP